MTALYDRIGNSYDTTRTADGKIVQSLAAHLNLQPASVYLDVGCGTGNYTTALSRVGGTWTGLDPSDHMLGAARAKAQSITWIQGASEALPFEDDSFDGAMCTLAIHHFADLGKAFSEVDRVLRPGGRFVLFTVTPEQVREYWVRHYFPEMMKADAEKLPSLDQIKAALQGTQLHLASVDPLFISEDTADFFFYSGKYRPEMYLSEDVRNGISSFRLLVSEAELADGLAALKRDIDSGAINQVIKDSENDLGDYCFVVIDKTQ